MEVYCAAFNIYDDPNPDNSFLAGIDFGENRLNDRGYGRLPLPVLLIVGPLTGLAYIIFFPVIVICTFGYLVFRRIAWKRSRKPFLSRS